ncbi:5-deoxyadenosylcobinamide phosphate nucleotidyltransferase [Methanolacinia petrolearia DSM 11571]|uniref:5-deoxyadenosylcobinamide phosphate nucleotidyltransferase n=1 Tax=Methanolacinia petrolearia (strain DSM 11571 / OCM 486 / SEBR 4847) TaxID=679926 RepID=E1RE95_METP4|nr:NTP transferase domain-containing protein [Methanolacinia petrolearia]ADN36058.1 5-deoxyadenosylcobinamide phosphate nucleotidyltransferase [Methanolacinia petrolearia DSM 11571]
MAGGAGSRLDMGEKPLVKVLGKPMLQYVAEAFIDAGCDILVITSHLVPMTKNWCRAMGYDFYNASGTGYVEDLFECIRETSPEGPVFSCVSDLPGITADIISEVFETYQLKEKPALSVWVPEEYFIEAGCTPSYVEDVESCPACPVGLNIIDASMAGDAQDEYRFLFRKPELAYNVNCKKDFESFLKFIEKDRFGQ